MAWLLRRIVDLFNALAAWYYRRKYGAAARRLGRPPHEEVDGRRGFIGLEIDGLAHHYLLRALKQGDMPYLARLLRDGTIDWPVGTVACRARRLPRRQASCMATTGTSPAFAGTTRPAAPRSCASCQDRCGLCRSGFRQAGLACCGAGRAIPTCSTATPGWRSLRWGPWAESTSLKTCGAWGSSSSSY